MKYWFLASRPKTLVAGFIPVLVGSAIAFQRNTFRWGIFWAALAGSLFIQIGTNLVNDAADFERGADSNERLGPARMAASGLLSAKQLYWGAAFSFAFASLAGIYLVSHAGWGILFIGICSIFFAVIYTAGPFPLAYLGLGDIFVFIFFGLVAVLGTLFAHEGNITLEAIILSSAIGLHSVSLIALNNLRDIPTDIKAGKKTLAVRMGDHKARLYYSLTLFLPFILWLFLSWKQSLLGWLLPLLTLPLAIACSIQSFSIVDRKLFNPLLGKTAALQLLFGIFVTLSLVLSV